jgi:hypothetical protein
MKPSRIIRGAILVILAMPVLLAIAVIIFYAEENWRGPHTWETTKASFEAKGETLDYIKLIPPSVQDDQNLGALPVFQLEPDPDDKGALKPLKLIQALANISSDNYRLPQANNFAKWRTADLKSISDSISKRYHLVFQPPSTAPEPTTLAALDALCPALAEIRSASQTRPDCRFAQDYVSTPAAARPLGLSTKLILLAQGFDLHAVLALHANRSDLAMEDMRVLFKIDAEMRREPELVSGLVGVGIEGIQAQAIREGIATHGWSDVQLRELDDSLGKIEFFSTYSLCLRGEAMGFFVPIIDEQTRHFSVKDVMGMAKDSTDFTAENLYGYAAGWFYWMMPSGWYGLSKAKLVNFYYQAADECADPIARRFYPEQSDEIARESGKGSLLSVGEILRRVASGPVLDCASTFARAQSQIDMERLTCKAERYRLTHGTYPKSLNDLAASLKEDPPRDVMSGEPYQYVLRSNERFFFYSVGWNQVDEGGKPGLTDDDPKKSDRKKGDWPWPGYLEK